MESDINEWFINIHSTLTLSATEMLQVILPPVQKNQPMSNINYISFLFVHLLRCDLQCFKYWTPNLISSPSLPKYFSEGEKRKILLWECQYSNQPYYGSQKFFLNSSFSQLFPRTLVEHNTNQMKLWFNLQRSDSSEGNKEHQSSGL